VVVVVMVVVVMMRRTRRMVMIVMQENDAMRTFPHADMRTFPCCLSLAPNQALARLRHERAKLREEQLQRRGMKEDELQLQGATAEEVARVMEEMSKTEAEVREAVMMRTRMVIMYDEDDDDCDQLVV
jgi:hypothetical protein